jgi:hypothetical protein
MKPRMETTRERGDQGASARKPQRRRAAEPQSKRLNRLNELNRETGFGYVLAGREHAGLFPRRGESSNRKGGRKIWGRKIEIEKFGDRKKVKITDFQSAGRRKHLNRWEIRPVRRLEALRYSRLGNLRYSVNRPCLARFARSELGVSLKLEVCGLNLRLPAE